MTKKKQSMQQLPKLNLGAGFNKISGWTNVDREPSTNPDVLWNLEDTPWPFESRTVSEILMRHALEHLGEQIDTYKKIWQEIYRVCVNGAEISIIVPHHNHENFWSDPTHCRVVTPLGLSLLSKKNNEAWIKMHAANSPLGIFWQVDFELRSVFYVSDEIMWKKIFPNIPRDDIKNQQILHENSFTNNLICEVHFLLSKI